MSKKAKDILCAILAAVFIILGAWYVSGCTKSTMVAPSGGAVTSSIGRVQTGVSTAQTQQQTVSAQAQAALDAQNRIDAKDKFLDAYRKWKAIHP